MLPFHALGYDDSIKLFVDWFLNGRETRRLHQGYLRSDVDSVCRVKRKWRTALV